MGVNGCDSFEMDETALTFAKSGFAPFSFPKPAEEQVPHSARAASLGVCPELLVLPLLFLFTKTKTCPEEFKPAAFALLINTNCKPVCLDLSVGREGWYMDREQMMRGHIWWIFVTVEVREDCRKCYTSSFLKAEEKRNIKNKSKTKNGCKEGFGQKHFM